MCDLKKAKEFFEVEESVDNVTESTLNNLPDGGTRTDNNLHD